METFKTSYVPRVTAKIRVEFRNGLFSDFRIKFNPEALNVIELNSKIRETIRNRYPNGEAIEYHILPPN